MAARPWENHHTNRAKESHLSVQSLKQLEAKTKNIKMDAESLKTTRPALQATSRVAKSENKPKKGRSTNGVSGNVPLLPPSPPPSADKPVLLKPAAPAKLTSPDKLRQEPNRSMPLSTLEIPGPAGHDSNAEIPSTGDSAFNTQPPSAHQDLNGAPLAAWNDGAVEPGPSCSSSCGSQHGNNNNPSTKANSQHSPISENMKTDVDATNPTNGENCMPASEKPTRNRYMAATFSAKAKARTSPKTRGVEGDETPAKLQKRLSFGSPSLASLMSPTRKPAARSKSIAQVRSSLQVDLLKEKSDEPLSPVGSVAHRIHRRKSFGAESRSATKWK